MRKVQPENLLATSSTGARSKTAKLMSMCDNEEKKQASSLRQSQVMVIPSFVPIFVKPGDLVTTDPTANDVLAGRGTKINRHPGNVALRELMVPFKMLYMNKETKLKVKAYLCASVVAHVRNLKPPGRFLEKCMSSEGETTWVDMGDERARRKVAQIFREDAVAMRSHLGMSQHRSSSKKKETAQCNSKKRKEAHYIPCTVNKEAHHEEAVPKTLSCSNACTASSTNGEFSDKASEGTYSTSLPEPNISNMDRKFNADVHASTLFNESCGVLNPVDDSFIEEACKKSSSFSSYKDDVPVLEGGLDWRQDSWSIKETKSDQYSNAEKNEFPFLTTNCRNTCYPRSRVITPSCASREIHMPNYPCESENFDDAFGKSSSSHAHGCSEAAQLLVQQGEWNENQQSDLSPYQNLMSPIFEGTNLRVGQMTKREKKKVIRLLWKQRQLVTAQERLLKKQLHHLKKAKTSQFQNPSKASF